MAVRRLVLVLVSIAVLAACDGGGDNDTADETTGPTPQTEGHDVVFTAPPPSTTTSWTTTTTLPPPTGLPDTFPVPDDGILSLSGSSTMSQGLEIREVPVDEIHDWLVDGLEDAGYEIVSDAARVVEFTGTGVGGRAEISGTSDPIDVKIVLGAPS
jgi:hypothetical protein